MVLKTQREELEVAKKAEITATAVTLKTHHDSTKKIETETVPKPEITVEEFAPEVKEVVTNV